MATGILSYLRKCTLNNHDAPPKKEKKRKNMLVVPRHKVSPTGLYQNAIVKGEKSSAVILFRT